VHVHVVVVNGRLHVSPEAPALLGLLRRLDMADLRAAHIS